VVNPLRKAADALLQAAARPVEKIDTFLYAGGACPPSQCHQTAIGTQRGGVELAFIVLADRYPQHDEQLAAGQIPDAGGLVKRGGDRVAAGGIHGKTQDRCSMHLRLDGGEGLRADRLGVGDQRRSEEHQARNAGGYMEEPAIGGDTNCQHGMILSVSLLQKFDLCGSA